MVKDTSLKLKLHSHEDYLKSLLITWENALNIIKSEKNKYKTV